MEILKIRDLDAGKQTYWIEKINECDWDAGRWLGYLLEHKTEKETFGGWADVILLTDDDKLLSFCTLAAQDEIDDISMTPWIGFVYTFPEFRGKRYSERIITYAREEAGRKKYNNVYISSEEVGLYEKYGFKMVDRKKSVHGYMTGIFVSEV